MSCVECCPCRGASNHWKRSSGFNMQHTSGEPLYPMSFLARGANSLPHTQVCAKTRHWWHTRKNPPQPRRLRSCDVHAQPPRPPATGLAAPAWTITAGNPGMSCAHACAQALPKTPDSPLWTCEHAAQTASKGSSWLCAQGRRDAPGASCSTPPAVMLQGQVEMSDRHNPDKPQPAHPSTVAVHEQGACKARVHPVTVHKQVACDSAQVSCV